MSKIEICTSCKGEGVVKEYDFRDYSFEKCGCCNGSGRLRVLEYSVSVPFGFDDYYEVDDQVVKLLRGLGSSSRSDNK